VRIWRRRNEETGRDWTLNWKEWKRNQGHPDPVLKVWRGEYTERQGREERKGRERGEGEGGRGREENGKQRPEW